MNLFNMAKRTQKNSPGNHNFLWMSFKFKHKLKSCFRSQFAHPFFAVIINNHDIIISLIQNRYNPHKNAR